MALNGGQSVITSPDDVNWTEQQNPEMKGGSVGGITFGNGIFVAVGAKILTSPDGANWTERTANVGQGLSAVTYGNGIFVAVGRQGTIMTSPDGVTWTSQESGTNDNLVAIAYGNGTFVALGNALDDSTSSKFTSHDGITWAGFLCCSSRTVVYGNNTFVSVGYDIETSPDGVNWTDRTKGVTLPGENPNGRDIKAIAFGGNTFLAAEENSGSCLILSSNDGVKWTVYDAGIDIYPLGVAYANGTFVVVGYIDNNGDQRATILQSAIFNGTGGQSSAGSQPPQTSSPPAATNTAVAKFLVGQNYYYTGTGDTQVTMDAAPFIDADSGRVLVPVRYLGDALGAQTTWDVNNQAVTVTRGGLVIRMVIGSTTLTVDGLVQTMDQAPVIGNGRTYLPARWVAEALGYNVSWNASGLQRTVVITQGN